MLAFIGRKHSMRTRKALGNLSANLGLQFVTALSGFIVPLLLIKHYGSEVNGLIGSIKQFMGYLALVEAGVGAATIAALYGPLGKNDHCAVNSILAATRGVYRKSGIAFGFCVVILAVAYPYILIGQGEPLTMSILIVIIGGGSLLEYFVIGQYRALLTASQKNYLISNVQSIATACNTLVSSMLILGNANVEVVQVVATSIFASRVVLVRHFALKHFPDLDFRARPDYPAISQRWSALMHQVVGVVVFNSPVVIITLFCGLREVSVYLVYGMIMGAITGLLGAFSSGLLGGFGELIAGGDRGTLAQAYSNYQYIFFALTNWVFSSAALLLIPFVAIYSAGFSDAEYVRPELAAAFLLIALANCLRIPPMTLVVAAGHFSQTMWRAVIEALVSLTASLVLVHTMGVLGVLIGNLCGYAYRTIDFLIYADLRIARRSVLATVRVISINLLASGLVILSCSRLFVIQPPNYLSWLGSAALVSLVAGMLICLFNAIGDRSMFVLTVSRFRGMRSPTGQIGES